MSSELANMLLAVIVAVVSWTSTIAALTWFISGKFRAMEQLVYRKINEERARTDTQLNDHTLRIYRLEYKVDGYTVLGRSPTIPPTNGA